MKQLKFKITIQKKLPIDLDINSIRKFPVHNHKLFETKTKVVIYEYEPMKNLNETEYLIFLFKTLKNKFNTPEITSTIELLN